MKYPQYLNHIILGPIRDKEWGARDNQLSCSKNAACAAQAGLIFQQGNSFDDPQNNTDGSGRIILGDVGRNLIEIEKREP
jgi:hypothetical protein